MNISLNSGMPNLKVRRQKFGIGALIFLMVIGLVFAGAGYAMYSQTKIDPHWTRVSGTVSSVKSGISNSSNGGSSTVYTPVVSYQVNGQTYQVASSVSSSHYPTVGSTKQVAYNPSYPNQAKVVGGAGSTALVLVFVVVGLALVVLSPVFFARSLRRSKDINNLQHSGIKLTGVIVDIQSNNTSTVNNTGSAYKIVVAATDNNGAAHNYVSDSLTGIGGLAMADFRSNPIPIDVYVNPTNPDDYYVDISDVPNLTPERISQLIQMARGRGMQSLTPTTPAAAQSANVTPNPAPPTPPSSDSSQS